MSGSSERKERRKGKFRFNFIDLLILALTVIVILSFSVSAFFTKEQGEDLLVSLRLEEADVSQTAFADLSLSEGQTVYKAGGKTVLGSLAKDYEGGQELLVVRVDAKTQGSDRYMGDVRLYIGQTVNIQCGQLCSYRLTVEEITEVAEND